jgi:hypothetical protein
MPTTEDIKLDENTSILLIGDSGTSKTTFFGTCPKPLYVIDTDKGMSALAGVKGIGFDTFKELGHGEKAPTGKMKDEGFYEWGTAYPAIIQKINEVGRLIDAGKCDFKVIGIDSLTMLTDVATSYILKQNSKRYISDYKDGRQFWGTFLNNMSELFGQLTAWPIIKVVTAHVRRDENQLTGVTEQLPLMPGQFSAKVSVYFDEVYFTDVVKGKYFLHTQTDAVRRQARSRKFKLPTGVVPTDYRAIMEHVAASKRANIEIVK